MIRTKKEKEYQRRMRHLKRARENPRVNPLALPTLTAPSPPLLQVPVIPISSSATEPVAGKHCVVFRVPWARHNVGWDILARAYARVMDSAGIDVRLYPPGGGHAEAMAEVGRFARAVKRWDLYIYSDFFAAPHIMRQIINQHLRPERGPRVFYSMFERRHVASSTAKLLSELTGVWVPCTANRDALHKAGCSSAVWIPVPFFAEDPLLTLDPPRSAKRFYWIGAWEPRKAPEMLMRAFFEAFQPKDAAHLTLKTHLMAQGWPSAEDVASILLPLNGWTLSNWRSGITVEKRLFSGRQMIKLHASNDVYVSASRGEGVDMPAFSAKLAGRRVITTDSGGPRDFLGQHDILVPATGEVPTHPSYNWESNAMNADYRLSDLVAAFQRAASEGAPPRDPPDPSIFRSDAVAVRMRKQVEKWISAG